jgi:Amt family ammonium transporter
MSALVSDDISSRIEVLQSSVETIIFDINSFWLIFGSSLVFFMQSGFALLEVGGVRAKNARNILTKNMLDSCVGTIMWYLFGYGFHGHIANADGQRNKFIGI